MAELLPQDLASLKRPALQKHCKRLGLKANGKNVEMVRLLEEYREKNQLEAACERTSPAGSDDVSEVERPSETQPAGQSQGAVCEVESGEMGDGVPSVSSEPRESVEEPHEPVQEGEGEEMTTEQERVRDRRITYSVSPKQPTNTSPHTCLHDDGVAMATDNNCLHDNGVATPTSGSRKRRRTHSVSPSSSLLSGTISLETADSTANAAPEVPSGVRVCTGETATEEIMALLAQRVADRKADPTYDAPPTSSSLNIQQYRQTGSRIPVSTTMEKINRAHTREFNKMQSILEYSEKKKKRALVAQNTATTPAPPAKRQKVVVKTPATPGQPLKKKTKLQTNQKITDTGLSKSRAMKPSTQPNFNFETMSDRAEPATSNGEAVQYTFSAKPNGTASFRKHRGKLPNFNFTIY